MSQDVNKCKVETIYDGHLDGTFDSILKLSILFHVRFAMEEVTKLFSPNTNALFKGRDLLCRVE